MTDEAKPGPRARSGYEHRARTRLLLLHAAAFAGMGSLIGQAFHKPVLFIAVVLILPWLIVSGAMAVGVGWSVLWRFWRR